MASNPYERAAKIFTKLGYEEGWEGFTCDSGAVPDLYTKIGGRDWKSEEKAYKAGAYEGYKRGWKKGYEAAVANEEHLYNTVWQMREDAPQADVTTGPWREEFEQGPPVRPMAVPSHLKK